MNAQPPTHAFCWENWKSKNGVHCSKGYTVYSYLYVTPTRNKLGQYKIIEKQREEMNFVWTQKYSHGFVRVCLLVRHFDTSRWYSIFQYPIFQKLLSVKDMR